jgi:P-type Cu2+ transporter
MSEALVAPALFSSEVACSHCGLPVPRGLERAGKASQFCCDGCRTVYQVINGAGLGRYYSELAQAGSTARRASAGDKTYAELDDPAFLSRFTRAAGPGLSEIEFQLENLHCPACVWLVEKLGKLEPGASATVDFGRGTVRVVWPPAELELSRVARTLASLGYPPHARQSANAADLRRIEDRALLARLAVAGAVFGNVMLMALALYSGAFQGMDAEYRAFFRWASLLAATPAVFWSAGVFYRGAWAALRVRSAHMDLPVSLGILAGFSSGAANVITGRGEIYFDSVTAVVFLLLIGRWLQRREQRAARNAADLLHSLSPSSARLVEGAATREVPIEHVPSGALLEVRAGEHFPADGVVVEGDSTVDSSLLSGESRPEEIGQNAKVHAGTMNVSARVIVRAERTGQATRVAKILRSVEQAAARRAPIALLADRVASRFVIGVLLLALVTAIGWWFVDPSSALEHAITVLIVTCPCALGLATPLAVSAAIGRAARRGILIKGGDALERLARPSTVFFDKTGTLTEGRLALVGFDAEPWLLPLVAAAEARSAHPIARAFLVASGDPPAVAVGNYQQTPGGGVRAEVDGRRLAIGSAGFVSEHADISEPLRRAAERAADAGETPIFVAVDGKLVALARFADTVRADARASLERLAPLAARVEVLSGDNEQVVRDVARRLGLPAEHVRGGVSPEAKLVAIERAVRLGPTVMVGDGVNDAAALARADVGIAVHGGAEASLAAADVFTTRPGVEPIAELFVGARRTFAVIRRNLLLSLGYNLVTATLAVTGIITPWMAALLMPLSSLTVVMSSYRARTFEAVS